MVARQFRVLEAWSSNLHTSTKKYKTCPCGRSYFFVGVGGTNFTLRSRMECAFQTKPSKSLFSSGKCRNIAHRAIPPHFDLCHPHPPQAVPLVSLRLGHLRGKTTLSCFLTLSDRYATYLGEGLYPTTEYIKNHRLGQFDPCGGSII